MASLTRLAAEAGVARGEDVILRNNPVPRFRDNPSMAHLEKHLFRYPLRPYEGETRIRIMEPPASVRRCARSVLRSGNICAVRETATGMWR